MKELTRTNNIFQNIMDNATIIDLVGYLGGIFLMISFIPQVYKSWILKETDQISILLLVSTLLLASFYEI